MLYVQQPGSLSLIQGLQAAEPLLLPSSCTSMTISATFLFSGQSSNTSRSRDCAHNVLHILEQLNLMFSNDCLHIPETKTYFLKLKKNLVFALLI